jgi:hypothetical protein
LLFGTYALADEEYFVSVAGSFLPFKLTSDDHFRLEAIDSSVAGVSNNKPENILNQYATLYINT